METSNLSEMLVSVYEFLRLHVTGNLTFNIHSSRKTQTSNKGSYVWGPRLILEKLAGCWYEPLKNTRMKQNIYSVAVGISFTVFKESKYFLT